MRILDRYVLKSILAVFCLCLFTFIFLYIIIDIFSYLEDILKQKVPFEQIVEYYLCYFPIIFVQVTPFSCLMATLYTFANLNRHNEIIAMRASGLSILEICKNVIIFGFIISLCVFIVNDRLVPKATALNQKIKYQMDDNKSKKNDKAQKETISNLSMYGIGNRLFFVNKFIKSTSTMEGVIILEHDEHQNIVRKIQAAKAIYQNGMWNFYQTMTWEFDSRGMVKGDPKFSDEEIIPIPETPDEFLSQKQSSEQMNIAQINDYIWKLSKSGATRVVQNLKIDLYQRYTSPLISLIIILVGIPFSFVMRRRATGVSSLGISIALAFLYYVFNAISIALGKGGVLPPVIAVSLSHITIFCFSFYLILKMP